MFDSIFKFENTVTWWCGAIAGFINLLAFPPYLRHIIRKTHNPSLIAWIIWAALGWIALVSYILTDERHDAVWVILLAAVCPTIVIKMVWSSGTFQRLGPADYFVGALAATAIGFLLATGSGDVAIWLAIAADTLAVYVTVVGFRGNPRAEPWGPWTTYGLAAVVNLGATNWSSATAAALPVYTALAVVAISAKAMSCQRDDVRAFLKRRRERLRPSS
ncbi:MAG TPA: hypothetical protein VJJ47_00785 [Candidatus Paceibacterota bacterium]